MLFRTKDLEAILAGRVTTAFRRWKRRGVKPGSILRTALGPLLIESIQEIDPAQLREEDAAAAGYPSLAALQAMFASQEGVCYRITLRPGGESTP